MLTLSSVHSQNVVVLAKKSLMRFKSGFEVFGKLVKNSLEERNFSCSTSKTRLFYEIFFFTKKVILDAKIVNIQKWCQNGSTAII